MYAQDVLKGKPGNLNRIEEYRAGAALLLTLPPDMRSPYIGTVPQGLFARCMDEAVNPAGARLVESFLARPERDLSEIRRRQACVLEFSGTPGCGRGSDTLRKGADLGAF